jgi:hypothetical protein
MTCNLPIQNNWAEHLKKKRKRRRLNNMEIVKKLVAIQQELRELGAISTRLDSSEIAVQMNFGAINNLGIEVEIDKDYKDRKHKQIVGYSNGVKFFELADEEDMDEYFSHLKEETLCKKSRT